MHRWLFAAAILAGVSYYFNDALVADGSVAHVVWKGAGVALLACWAASREQLLLAAILACGAAGDVLIETAGLTVGAVAFLAGHVLAVALYVRNQRPLTQADVVVGAVILVATPVLAASLPGDRGLVWGIGVYAAGLGAMAATAWTSRFPRGQVGLGALLFVVSDLLIFAKVGPLQGSALPDIAIWPLYFAGQALIAAGVVRGTRR